MKRALFLGGLVALLCGLLSSGAFAAENVKVAWRSAYGTPYAEAVNTTDGSVWAATGNSLVHAKADGTVLKQVEGFYMARSVVVNQSDGTVWVADTGHNQVVELGADGTELQRLSGFKGPTSVDIDSDASTPVVWVADTANNQVVQLNVATGAAVWTSPAGAFSSPRSVSANTYLHTCWVADTGHNQVVQLDSDGTEAGRYSGFTAPSAVAVQAQDWHPIEWVADTGANRLVELNENGLPIHTVTGCLSPQAVAVDPITGLCWAMDTGNHQVVHLDTGGNVIFRGGAFDTPSSVALNATDGSCWVGDSIRAQITHLAAAGTQLTKAKSLLTLSPMSAASATDNTLWLGVQGPWDSTVNRYPAYIIHMGLDGSIISQTALGQEPDSIAVNPTDGSVWVADDRDQIVVHLTSKGDVAWTSADSEFSSPTGLAVNPTTNEVWIADYYDDQLVCLASSSTAPTPPNTETWVEKYRLSGYSGVNAVAVDVKNQKVWASVNGLDLVAQFDAVTGKPTGNSFSCNGPYGVAVDNHDPTQTTVWVGDHDTLYHINTDGTEIWHSADYAGANTDGHNTLQVSQTDGSVLLIGWSTPYLLTNDGALIWSSSDYGNSCLALCPDNSFWLGDDSKNMVWHLAPDGMVVKQVSGFRQPSGVSVRESDESGWVADASGLGAVHLKGSDGSTLSTTSVDQAVGLAVNQSDGSVWVADHKNLQLLHFDATGAAIGSPLGGFASITGGAVDSHDSSLWVAETTKLDHFSSSGGSLGTVSGFTDITCVAVDPKDDSVWVADKTGGTVEHLKGSDGSLIGSALPFAGPTAVAVNTSDESVWVLSATDGKLTHLKADGTTLGSSSGFHDGSLAIDSKDGSVWVADTGGGAVVHVKADGTELWRGTEYPSPVAISVSPTEGAAWVCDAGLAQVVRLVVAPTADFSADKTAGAPPLTVNFTDKSTGSPTTWAWTFGDTASNTSTSQNPSHTYTAVGAYTVSLTVTSAVGTDTATKPNYINAGTVTPPVADFSADKTSGTAPLAVKFTDLSTNNPTAWAWVFGDNGTTVGATTQNPSHTYATNGSYTVSLTATNAGGANTKTKTNYIVVGALAADFSATPTSGIAQPSTPLSVAFTDLSPNSPTSWSWNFGDPGSGTSNTSTQQNPIHSYAKPGTYTVSLTATGATGAATATKAHYILVSFPDVPVSPAYWALKQILACVDASVVGGYPDGSYGPALQVTRDQMAVYISRAVAKGDANIPAPAPGTQSFTDVDSSYWAYKWIEYAKAQNIVTGYPDGSYGPTNVVTRDQMAVYISRALPTPSGVPTLANYTPPTTPSFPDVPTTYWAYKWIEYAKLCNVVAGYPDGTYAPTNAVTRDQMAVYVQRAFTLPMAP